MAPLGKPLEEYESVKTWFAGLRDQSGVDPAADPSRLEYLKEFCEFAGLDPDQAIRACLLIKEGKDTKISIKGRRAMAERIAAFQGNGEPRERARRGNTIRSFLIHNGILLQSGIQV